MKKTAIYILLICAGIFSACESFLTYDDPKQVTDDDWWNSEQDARNALSTIYSFRPEGHSGFMRYSYATDEAFAHEEDDFRVMANGDLHAENGQVEKIWNSSYKYIRRANRFLEHVDNVKNSDLTERYKYEARTLRAWIYLELTMWFGDVPLVLDVVNPGTENASFSRDSLDKVMAFVISELNECAENLPSQYPSVDDWRMTSGAANSLKAYAHLWMEQWSSAANAAKKVVESGVYKLYDETDNPYRDLFTQTGELNKERIIHKGDGCKGSFNAFAPPGVGGSYSKLTPLASLVESYETLQGKLLSEMSKDSLDYYRKNPTYNRDPRLTATVIVPGDELNGIVFEPFKEGAGNENAIGAPKSSRTGFWCKKYVDERERNVSGKLDYMILRLADVMLMYCEAKVELNDFQNDTVISYVNQIRSRAGMPDIDLDKYNSQEKMRELIRRERKVELALEGRRIFDIRRWKDGALLQGVAYGAAHPITGARVVVETRNFVTPTNYWFPIPAEERRVNNNMDQNNGY